MTTNLSARGAYFKTFSWQHFREGGAVSVKILVPHPLNSGEGTIHLSMQTGGRVARLDRILGREALGENGIDLKGVAIQFDEPLSFRYMWG